MKNFVRGQKGSNRRSLLIVSLTSLFVPFAASAHEVWFVSEQTHGDIPAFFRSPPWSAVLLGISVLLLVLWRIVFVLKKNRALPSVSHQRLGWMAWCIGIGTGITLLGAGASRVLFASNLALPDGTLWTAIDCLELAIGAACLLGVATRFFSGCGILLWCLGVLLFGVGMRDQGVMLGSFLFLFVFGRGPLTVSTLWRQYLARYDASAAYRIAFFTYHLLLGSTLLVLGVEKLIRPDLHFAVLEMFQGANPFVLYRTILPMLTREWYLFLSAGVELCAGLFLFAGVHLRPVALILLIPFCFYPIFFGWEEIIGHAVLMGGLCACVLMGERRITAA